MRIGIEKIQGAYGGLTARVSANKELLDIICGNKFRFLPTKRSNPNKKPLVISVNHRLVKHHRQGTKNDWQRDKTCGHEEEPDVLAEWANVMVDRWKTKSPPKERQESDSHKEEYMATASPIPFNF